VTSASLHSQALPRLITRATSSIGDPAREAYNDAVKAFNEKLTKDECKRIWLSDKDRYTTGPRCRHRSTKVIRIQIAAIEGAQMAHKVLGAYHVLQQDHGYAITTSSRVCSASVGGHEISSHSKTLCQHQDWAVSLAKFPCSLS
jgi:hypothetical protein